MSSLTPNQLQQIEENRKKALKLKKEKASLASSSSALSGSSAVDKCGSSNSQIFSSDQQSIKGLQCNAVGEDRFVVTCNYSSKLISIFKTIPSKQYDPASKSWTFSLSDFSNLRK